MKVEQLSLADYNKIKNIPVVNQDLSAGGFTPVANTYYRHTGTAGTYKQGVIYYYDGTEYKALDGASGAQGPQGEDGNATYIYNGLLDASVADVQVAQITIPTGRTLQAEDILISSYESSVGAMAQVVSIADGGATVNFIGQISTGGGGTTLNKYTYDVAMNQSKLNLSRLLRIISNAKGTVGIAMGGSSPGTSLAYSVNTNSYWLFTGVSVTGSDRYLTYVTILVNYNGDIFSPNSVMLQIQNDGTRTVKNIVGLNELMRITYYNDTEIT